MKISILAFFPTACAPELQPKTSGGVKQIRIDPLPGDSLATSRAQ